jgi:hypothetical protein
MTDTTSGPTQAPSLVKVLAALAEVGEATAAAVAARAGLGYSTTTPKLRELEKAGQAEPFHAADRRTLWRLTEAGRTTLQAGPAVLDDAPVGPEAGGAGSIIDKQVALTRVEGAAGERAEPVDEESDERSEPADEETTAASAGGTDGDDTEEVASTPAEEEATSPAVSATDGVESIEPDTSPVPAGSGDATSEPQVSDDLAAPVSVDGPNGGESPADDPRPDGPDAEQPDSDASTDANSTSQAAPTSQRRAKGALRGAVVDILENHPDRQYKVGELCKLINQAEQESKMPKASAGAVANVLDKLAGAGVVVQTVVKPATFQLAPRED